MGGALGIGIGNAFRGGRVFTMSLADAIASLSPNRLYKFDEVSGNFADSGSDNELLTAFGTITYGQTSLIPSIADTCCLFNGSTGYAKGNRLLYGASGTQVSLVTWMKTTTTAAFSLLYAQYNNSIGVLFGTNAAGKLVLAGRGGGVYTSSTSSIVVNDGAPHCVGFSIDGATPRMYIDGVYDSAATYVNYNGNPYSSTSVYAVSANFIAPSTTNNFFLGHQQYQTAFNYILSDAEFALLYASGQG